MAPVEIRPAEPGDASALAAFATALYAEGLPTIAWEGGPLGPDVARRFLELVIEQPRSVVLLAFDGDEVLGSLSFHGSRQTGCTHGGALSVAVDRAHRGTGIGTALVQALCEWAPQNGIRRVELEVVATNVAAQRLYERLGFEREGCRRGAVEVNGKFEDLILMARFL